MKWIGGDLDRPQASQGCFQLGPGSTETGDICKMMEEDDAGSAHGGRRRTWTEGTAISRQKA